MMIIRSQREAMLKLRRLIHVVAVTLMIMGRKKRRKIIVMLTRMVFQ